MNATLRLLALLGLAPFSFALVRLVMTPPPTTGYSCCSDLGLSALTVVALLGFAAVVAAGIGATMVSLERRERGWTPVLVSALALNTIWAVAFTLLSPFVVALFQDSLHRENARLLFEYTPEAVLAVVVLAYTVAQHPDVAGLLPLPAVNGAVRALTLAGSLGLILFALSFGFLFNVLQLSPLAQDFFAGGGAVLAVAGACLLIVDCLQRRRRGRAIALIVVLLFPFVWRLVFLLAYIFIPPLVGVLNSLAFSYYLMLIVGFVPFLPVAVLALVLSFLPRAAPPAATPVPVAESTGGVQEG